MSRTNAELVNEVERLIHEGLIFACGRQLLTRRPRICPECLAHFKKLLLDLLNRERPEPANAK